MLENLIFSANVVLPTFLMIMIGRLLVIFHYADDVFIEKLNKIVFRFCLSALLFRNIYTADFSSAWDKDLVLFCLWMVLAFVVVVGTISAFFIKDGAKLGSFVQGTYRGNFIIMGMPIVQNIFGPEAGGRCAIILAIIVTVYGIVSVLVLCLATAKRDAGPSVFIKDTLWGLIKNPHIITIVIGMCLNVLRVPVPKVIMEPIGYLGDMAVPAALISIGGVLNMDRIKESLRLTVVASIIKTVVMPLVTVPIALYLGFRGLNLVIIAVLFGAPPAVSSFSFAQSMKANAELAANIIMVATFMSVFTIMASIYILKTLGLI
jgi:predicted permease